MSELFSNYSPEEAARMSELIAGYIRGELNDADHRELDDWVNESDENMIIFEKLTDPERLEEKLAWMRGLEPEQALRILKQKIKTDEKRKPIILRLLPYAAAAAVLIAVFFLWRFMGTGANKSDELIAADIFPNSERAALVVGDGRNVMLSQSLTGVDLMAGISFENNRRIVYHSKNMIDTGTHELIVPEGAGTYHVVLSDGSSVQLNAGSSLEYPVEFSQGERRVELKGEGFFDIAKDASRPFVVVAGRNSVRVLGTKFNINSYGDRDEMVTSVTEGSVSVMDASGKTVALAANETGVIHAAGDLKKINGIDESEIAWREDKFLFEDAGIEEVMHELGRWYDANVIFDQKPQDHFNLEIQRNIGLKKILALLEKTERVKFEVEGRTVRVRGVGRR